MRFPAGMTMFSLNWWVWTIYAIQLLKLEFESSVVKIFTLTIN